MKVSFINSLSLVYTVILAVDSATQCNNENQNSQSSGTICQGCFYNTESQTYEERGCPVFKLREGCFMEPGERSDPYPRCCPRPRCPTPHETSTSTQTV